MRYPSTDRRNPRVTTDRVGSMPWPARGVTGARWRATMADVWGPQTQLAIDNFPISGEPMPAAVVREIVRVKRHASAVNAGLAVIEPAVADAIWRACGELLDDEGAMVAQFPVDVFQTGSGTSTNMNANEVIAHRATELLGDGRRVHPNDHVNASQSSNDVVPTAIRIAALAEVERSLVPALTALAAAVRERAVEFDDAVTIGRTHLMDAAPVTFGQQLRGWARQVELGVDRVRDASVRMHELPLGGTAVGSGLNAPQGFGAAVIERIAGDTGLSLHEAGDHFEAQSTQDAPVELSGALRTVALSLNKIALDLRLLGSGPSGGFAEVHLPELQAGSSIMPGKVNPVIPEVVQQVAAQVVGNDAAIAFAAASLSTLQLSVAMPVVARNLLSSVALLTSAARVLDEKCVRILTVDRDRMAALAERSSAVTMVLVPHIGYDAAAKVSKRMQADDLSLRDALAAEGVDVAIDVDLLSLALGRSPD